MKDQGVERDPTVHLGPGVTALERDGIPSRLGDINRQVVAEHRVDRQLTPELTELKVLQPQTHASDVQRPADHRAYMDAPGLPSSQFMTTRR